MNIVFNYCAIMNQVTAMDVQNTQTNKRISLINRIIAALAADYLTCIIISEITWSEGDGLSQYKTKVVTAVLF